MANEATFTCSNVKINTDLLYSMLSTEQSSEIIKQRDKKIKQLEEEKENYKQTLTKREVDYASLYVEYTRIKKQLDSFIEYYPTTEEMLKKQEELASTIGKLTVEIERMKQQGVTIDMVEKAAYDVIRGFIRENDDSRNSLYATRSDEALVLLATTRLIERIKQYAEKY